MTCKPKACAWQVTCPRWYGGHTNFRQKKTLCRITLSFKTAEEDIAVQRRCKHWANEAYNAAFNNRLGHQKWRPSIEAVPSVVELVNNMIPSMSYSGDEAVELKPV